MTYRYHPLILALMACASPMLMAQSTANETVIATDTLSTAPITLPYQVAVSKPQRMSEWLIEHQPQLPQHYDELATIWLSADEKTKQIAQRTQLIKQLTVFSQKKSSTEIAPLFEWLQQLPVTGRVFLPAQDARFLQAQPQLDPLLQQGDQVRLLSRSPFVTVLFDNAQGCRVHHQANATAGDYIQQCHRQFGQSSLDKAYLIEPTGRVTPLKVAHWNQHDQPIPTGAWIWVTSTQHRWSNALAQQVAQFIAYQGADLALPHHQSDTAIALDSISKTPAQAIPTTSSDWGSVGLLQTPTARMHTEGTAATHIAHYKPYTHYHLLLQPFDRLETTLRVTHLDDSTTTQQRQTKSVDVKLKLLNEDRFKPEVAVGVRDFIGHGAFASEYLVANKRYGQFDFSLGLGWGYLAQRGDIDNPFHALLNRDKIRQTMNPKDTYQWNNHTWFTGKSAIFGGVQWHSPHYPLSVKVEYDANNYNQEPYHTIEQDSPINVGVTWQNRYMEVSTALERGNTWLFGVALRSDLSQLGQYKDATQQQTNVVALQKGIQPSMLHYRIPLSKEGKLSDRQQFLAAFTQATGWQASQLSYHQGTITVIAEDDGGAFIQERLQRGMEILNQVAPANATLLTIQLRRYDVPITTFSVQPALWQQQQQQLLPTVQRVQQPITLSAPVKQNKIPPNSVFAHKYISRGQLSFYPSLEQHFNGKQGYTLGLFANANVNYRFGKGLWLNGTAQARLADNYDQLDEPVNNGTLNPVRSQLKAYATASRIGIPHLQLTQFKQLDDHVYGLAYAGYLESMFAGVGGEVLYRPMGKPWAIGLDINQVYQRDAKQPLNIQSYKTTTGHVSMYWHLPQNIHFKLSAGQYLAGDRGATLDISRLFQNGVKMGAWATHTNVKAHQSPHHLEQGVYVAVPFDALFKQWSEGHAQLIYQPELRDNGARLNRLYTLYDLTTPSSKYALDVKNPLHVR